VVQGTTGRPRITATIDGWGVVSHAGARLLADLADASTLTGRLSGALVSLAAPQTAHDPGRVLADLAVAIADGGDCISDIAVLADQLTLFGRVASDSTVWRLLERLDADRLAQIAAARAEARETVWRQRAESTGAPFPTASAAGRVLAGLVIDLDATIVVAHSEKEQAAATFKGSFGYHPMLATLDNTGEFLAAVLRPGNAGANTAADHISVLDAALAQVPDEHRHGTPILIRADTAGCVKAFLAHVHGLRHDGVDVEFSVGWRTDRLHEAIAKLPDKAWVAAIDVDGDPVDSAQVAELTGLLPPGALADYPAGMRLIIRRERPHPGAQLDLFEQRDGWRYTAFATTTPLGQLAHLDARHRAHARVEDRIRCAKDTGLGRFPSRAFAINHAWLTAVMIAVDLLTWAQTMLLHDAPALAKAEPKTLRYRLLHVAARLTRGQRRLWLRIDRHWRWAVDLARAFTRLATLPQPIT
jgi:Transposase DDE domain group 1